MSLSLKELNTLVVSGNYGDGFQTMTYFSGFEECNCKSC